MDCHDAAGLLPDYLQHSLTEAQTQMVEEHLRECADCREDVDLWERLQSVRSIEPTGTMRARFEQMLGAYRDGVAADRNWRRWFGTAFAPRWLQVAAGVALVAVAFTAGTLVERARDIDTELARLRLELENTRQMVAVSLLQNQSASDRLAGVSWSAKLPQANPEILEALLDRLRTDDSVDVRLAALDALRRYGGEVPVRQAVLGSLGHQQSPLVQVAVVDFLVACGARDAVPELQRLERNPDLLPEVRQRIEWGIRRLKQG